MKIQITNVYDDSNTLIATNPLVSADARMRDIYDMGRDLDLIIEHSYGSREILKKYLKEDETEVYTYNLTKLHSAVYSCLVLNLQKYLLMLKTDDSVEEIDPLEQFRTETTYGQKQRTDSLASRVDTTTHGDIDTTTNVGQSTETSNLGSRDVTESVTSFSSSAFNDTAKSVQGLTQDSTTYGQRQDTEKITKGNDTVTRGAHIDTHTDAQHTTTVVGYRDEVEGLTELRDYSKNNTLKEIVNDVINYVSYGMYLF